MENFVGIEFMGLGDKGVVREGNKRWLGGFIVRVSKKIVKSLREGAGQKRRKKYEKTVGLAGGFISKTQP